MDRFEENLGKYAYVSLAQVKDYLTISSNDHDARISNLISYATGIVEHYIGYEVLANDYVEVLDGGTSSISVNRLPLTAVYKVEEFDGSQYKILADSYDNGLPNYSQNAPIAFTLTGAASVDSRTKKFGKSSLKLDETSSAVSTSMPETVQFDDRNFTIEAFIKPSYNYLQDNVFLTISTDASNYLELKTANQYGVVCTTVVDGSSTVARGANTYVERQQYQKKKWAHVAVTKDNDNDRMYVFYNGNTIANVAHTDTELAFTSNITIGGNFAGYIDELVITDEAKYLCDFTAPTNRIRPNENTALLLHVDGDATDRAIYDSSSKDSEYIFTRDTGKISKFVNGLNSLTITGKPVFNAYPNGVKVTYQSGYASTNVPSDLQTATLDLIKILYKQEQTSKNFSLQGESKESHALSNNFPPSIKRVLDLYRIIE